MKVHLLIAVILVFLCCSKTNAQLNSNYFIIEYTSQGKNGYFGMKGPLTYHIPDTAVSQVHEIKNLAMREGNVPKSPLQLTYKLDKPQRKPVSALSVPVFSKNYQSYLLRDSSGVTVLAMGINESNYHDYVYRIVENDSVQVLPWTELPGLEQQYGAKVPYGLVGRFKAPGKLWFIEVSHKKNYNIRDGLIFDWRNGLKPQLEQIAVFIKADHKTQSYYLHGSSETYGMASSLNPKTNIPSDFRVKEGKIVSIQLYFRPHETVNYEVRLKRKGSDSWTIGYTTSNMFELSSLSFAGPGKYEVIVSANLGDGSPAETELKIPVEILPAPLREKKIPLETVLAIGLGILVIGWQIFMWYKRRNKRRLKDAAQQRQAATLKLRSVRAQLNPHFMFNALSAIQSLINKRNTDEANRYLSKFARFTRQVLDDKASDLQPIQDEVDLLEDYLQMEQLRYEFSYDIKIGEAVDSQNIEIPSMLLQPYVENAVKHGVSLLGRDGRIHIEINLRDTDLIFSVSDNGNGFLSGSGHEGYGLNLGQDYVTLLNELHPEQPVVLAIDSDINGTNVTITLTKWLS